MQDTKEKQGAKLGLKIVATNSKLMCICSKRGDGVSMKGEQVEEVDEFMYLRSIVTNKGGADEDIQTRLKDHQ